MTRDIIPQVEQLRDGVDYRFKVTIRKFSIMLRPLSIYEVNKVAANVSERMEEMNQYQRNQLTEHTLVAQETLKLASTSDVDVDDPTITDLIISKMTAEEVSALFKEYVAITDKCNPVLELLPNDVLKSMIEDIKKNPSLVTERSFLELASICRSLIQGG